MSNTLMVPKDRCGKVQLAIIDAIGPFFRNLDQRRINWSKIPFADLPVTGDDALKFWSEIRLDFERFAEKARHLGFNAVTLDDVAHLVPHPDYEPELRERTAFFAEQFHSLINLLRGYGFKVFVTSDYLSLPPSIARKIGSDKATARKYFGELLKLFFHDFPEVDGVILRVGESDGVDVRDPLRSHLAARSAECVNSLLRHILPIFEATGKTLIFRTWTVGASLLGDLIWNQRRLERALKGINSTALIISMKPGESDFFRYLTLNEHFFRTDLPKIIEFQARREYEGAGEYPSFIGWDLEAQARDLHPANNVIGISVWCQTGGWHRFRRLSLIDDSSVWVELNALAAVEIFKNGGCADDAILKYFGEIKFAAALEFLRLAEAVILRLLYIKEFAEQPIFFRRVRIPPLIHVYWDCVLVVEPVREILRRFVTDHAAALREGEEAFAHFPRMRELASELDLPLNDIDFMRDSMEMVLLARRFFFQPFTPETPNGIEAAKAQYKTIWPRNLRPRYRIKTSFEPSALQRPMARWFLRIVLRRSKGYRTLIDRIFTLNFLSWGYRLLKAHNRKSIPKMLRKSAMGVDAVMR